MRIVVVSDTHGDFFRLKAIVDKHLKDAGLLIHLGDGNRELEDIQTLYPQLRCLGVRGNCDQNSDAPCTLLTEAGGKTILATHGHLYGVKGGLDRLKQAARQNHAHIVLYGHTHQNFTGYEEGLHIMNPGSLSKPRNYMPSYGIIDITEGGILTNVVEGKRFVRH